MRKYLAGLAGTALAAAMMLTGVSAGELTAEDVLVGYLQSSMNVQEAYADVAMNLTVNIKETDAYHQMRLEQTNEEGETEMPPLDQTISADMAMNMGFDLDPIALEVHANVNTGELAGNSTIEAYVVTNEDGSISAYIGPDGEWVVINVPAEESSKVTEALASVLAESEGADLGITAEDLAGLPVSFELRPETVNIDGTDCYSVYTVLYGPDIVDLIAAADTEGQLLSALNAQADTGITSYDEVKEMADGLLLNIELDVNAEDFRVKALHFDMNGSVISPAIMEKVAPGAGTLLTITLDNASYDCVYNMDTPVEVTVPQEVIDNAEEIPYEEIVGAVTEELGDAGLIEGAAETGDAAA